MQGADRPGLSATRGHASRVWKPFYLKSEGIATVSVARDNKLTTTTESKLRVSGTLTSVAD